MEVIDLSLRGLKIVKPRLFFDNRGYFTEFYKKNSYFERGIDSLFVQDNHSFSEKNVIRGMHFQLFPKQDKLVSVIRGKVFDVAVDIRRHSPTYGQWEGIILDDKRFYQFFIPAGFAHGFCVLSENAHLFYKTSDYFNPENQRSFHYNDPVVNIKWPVENPVLSDSDRDAPSFLELAK